MKLDNEGQLPLPVSAVHRWATEYLGAVRRHYDTMTRAPSNVEIALLLHIAPRTWDHRKQQLRDGSMGRDWIEVWPPPRDWHPTWEHLLGAPNGEPQDGFRELTFKEVYDKDGTLVRRTLLGLIAAGVTSSVLLDMADGRLDGVLHLNKVFLAVLKWCATLL